MPAVMTKERRILIMAYIVANPEVGTAALSRKFGHAKSTICKLKELVGMLRQGEKCKEDSGCYLPSPETIKEVCAEIQAGWPPEKVEPWSVPEFAGRYQGRNVIFEG